MVLAFILGVAMLAAFLVTSAIVPSWRQLFLDSFRPNHPVVEVKEREPAGVRH